MACPSCGTVISEHALFAHYQAMRRLDSGGLGDVMEAIDSVTGRRVAVKTLRNQLFKNPQFVAQFAREATILGGLSHPNIVEVYEFFEIGGVHFLAMEYVEGGSLLGRIRMHGRMPERELIRLGMDLVRGLTAALTKGVLHRDVKPANILFDAHGRAKLVDFGLAMSLGESVAEMGGAWGSPYYIAPERLEGQPEDFLADMYSLGVTLFHAAAGRTPFQATSASVMAWKHLKAQHVSAKTFAPHLSDETIALINRCTARRPEDRFPSYFELLDALETAEKRLIFARPNKAPPPDLIGAWRESNWALRWIGIGASLILLLAGGLFALKARNRGPDFEETLSRSDRSDTLAAAPVPAKTPPGSDKMRQARNPVAPPQSTPAAPTATSVAITTAEGSGADTFIRASYASFNYGNRPSIFVQANKFARGELSDSNRKAYLRFDLSSVPRAVAGAALVLVLDKGKMEGSVIGPVTLDVYGLNDGHAGENWVEGDEGDDNEPPGELVWNNAPGNDTLSSGGFLGSETTRLGSVTVDPAHPDGDTLTFSSPELTTFLNADRNGLVTLMLGVSPDAPRMASAVRFKSRESSDGAFAPRLDLSVSSGEQTRLAMTPGDFAALPQPAPTNPPDPATGEPGGFQILQNEFRSASQKPVADYEMEFHMRLTERGAGRFDTANIVLRGAEMTADAHWIGLRLDLEHNNIFLKISPRNLGNPVSFSCVGLTDWLHRRCRYRLTVRDNVVNLHVTPEGGGELHVIADAQIPAEFTAAIPKEGYAGLYAQGCTIEYADLQLKPLH